MEQTKASKTQAKKVSRRQALEAGLAVVALPLIPAVLRQAAAQERKITTLHGFETAADIAKAEQEGEVLYYTHDSEPGAAGIVEAFGKDFPKIKGKYFRLQNSSLFSKVLAERQAGQYNVDVIQFSEPTSSSHFGGMGDFALS
jgi:iron(III) transport system substrate-binding protein